MKKQGGNTKPENYGNVTFGEASKLLVDIIGQKAILDLMPEKEHEAYKRKLERMYLGQAVYHGLATAKLESPQWYFEQFFKDENGLEKRYALDPLAMILVDSFTWQYFNALISHTPFEKTKKETVLYLARKQLFKFTHDLIEGKFAGDGNRFQVSKKTIMDFLTDSYDKVFSDIEQKYKNSETLYKVINDYYDKNREKYFKASKKELTDCKQNIINWRNESVYNPNWKVLVPILDFLYNQNKKQLVHRLIGLYLLKNTQKALSEILDISYQEQEKIIIDIVTMLNEDKQPEEFYEDNYNESAMYIELVSACLAYQHKEYPDNERMDTLVSALENKCPHSKIFFSPWLRARAKVFERMETLQTDKELQKEIIRDYKKAFDEGSNYAGEYMGQFILEAVMVNRYCEPRNIKDINDYYGYGYALEMFREDKKELLDLIKNRDDLRMEFASIHYSQFSPAGKKLGQYYPDFHSIIEYKNEAINSNNKGLEFDKQGNSASAIQCFDGAIALNPVYVNAYSNRGNVYDKMGSAYAEQALYNFDMALLLDPQHENTLFNRGSLLLKTGRFEDAIKDAAELITINPKDSGAYVLCGNCHLSKNDFNAAIADYTKAIEITPDCTEAYHNRGGVYRILGDNNKALADFQKAEDIYQA